VSALVMQPCVLVALYCNARTLNPALPSESQHILGQAGSFDSHQYRYYCVRCLWLFLVVNPRGDALDEPGKQM
jgi:hypothetical protein